jgi:hypothetical protein
MKSTRSTTCDLRDQADVAVHSFRNVLFSKPGGCVHFHPPGPIHFRLTRKAVVPVHHGCEISEKQRSSFVSDSRNGRGFREPNGPLALGSFDPLMVFCLKIKRSQGRRLAGKHTSRLWDDPLNQIGHGRDLGAPIRTVQMTAATLEFAESSESFVQSQPTLQPMSDSAGLVLALPAAMFRP